MQVKRRRKSNHIYYEKTRKEFDKLVKHLEEESEKKTLDCEIRAKKELLETAGGNYFVSHNESTEQQLRTIYPAIEQHED